MIIIRNLKLIGDNLRISKYKNVFANRYTPNWSEEIFGTFFENKFNQTNQKEFRIEKVTKKKGDKLYVNGKVIIIGLIVGSIKKTV